MSPLPPPATLSAINSPPPYSCLHTGTGSLSLRSIPFITVSQKHRTVLAQSTDVEGRGTDGDSSSTGRVGGGTARVAASLRVVEGKEKGTDYMHTQRGGRNKGSGAARSARATTKGQGGSTSAARTRSEGRAGGGGGSMWSTAPAGTQSAGGRAPPRRQACR